MGAAEGRDKLHSLDNTSRDISKKGFGTVDLLSAFAKAVGSAMDLANRLSAEFDLKDELLSGRVNVLTKTDCLSHQDKEPSKHTSCFYNWFSKQMIGNYENWVFAQPVKDRCLVSYKSVYDILNSLMGMGLVNVCRCDLPPLWGPVYPRYSLGLEKSDDNRLSTPSLPQEELPPVSSRD